ADAAVRVAHVLAEDHGGDEDERQNGEGDEGEPPLHAQHDGDDEGEGKDVFKNGDDAGGEHFVEGIDVAGEAGDEAAYGVAVIKGDMHPLEVGEDLAAEIEHDLLAGPLHEVGLGKLAEVGNEEGSEIDAGDLGDAGPGIVAEPAGEPLGLGRGMAGHIAVDGDGDEVGSGYVADGLDEDGDDGNADSELVGSEIGEQAAHEARVIGFANDFVVVRLLRLFLLCFVLVGHAWFLFYRFKRQGPGSRDQGLRTVLLAGSYNPEPGGDYVALPAPTCR